LKFGRKFDSLKKTSRIQVIFAGFVNDAYQIVRLGAGILKKRKASEPPGEASYPAFARQTAILRDFDRRDGIFNPRSALS